MRNSFITRKVLFLFVTLIFSLGVNVNLAYGADVKCGEDKTFTVADVVGADYSWKLVDNATGVIVTEYDNYINRNVCTMTIPSKEGSYTLSVIADLDGCKQIIESELIASSIAISVSISGEDWLCESQERILEAVVTSTEVNADEVSYAWYHDGILIDGETDKLISVSEEGLYEVKVKAVGSTILHSAIKEFDTPKELPFLEVDDSAKLYNNVEIEIGNNADWDNDKGYKYQWSVIQEGTDKEIILTDETDSKISISKIDKAGVFTVKASSDYCTSVGSINVIRWFNIGVPSAFSIYEGDNLKVLGNQAGVEEVSFIIYNRDGLKMYETSSVDSAFNDGWDGTYNGVVQAIDGYVYFLVVKFDDGEIMKKKGSISLLK